MSQAPAIRGTRAAVPRPLASGPAVGLTAEIKHDVDLGAEDAASLATLLDARPQVGAFLSPAWLSGFFAEPRDGFEPSLLLLREGSALRGMAPIGVRRARRHVRVTLLGGGAGSDRTDLVAARGYEAACADALLSWLTEAFGKGFVLELRDVPADSSLFGAVHRANEERSVRLALQPREVHTLPFLDMLAAAPGRAHPRSVDKHRRWLERRGALRIERLEDAGEALRGLEALARFLHARWAGREGGSALDDPRALRFHRHALPLLLREKHLRMLRLTVGNRAAAVFYGVARADWWGYCLAGYDREWAGRIHLGQVTLAAAIDLAAQEGASEFDFLKGAHRVKYLWPVRERATLDADVYGDGPAGQLARAARAAREAAAALGKSARAAWRT